MKILGIRTAPAQIRYALIEVDDGTLNFLNRESEHMIRMPAGLDTTPDKLHWVKGELDRILRQNEDLARAVIKTGEYGRSETISIRVGAYLDAIVFLACTENNIPVEGKIYSQLGTNRSQVKEHAEHRVGRTPTHWNEQMADAVIAAWSSRKG